MHSPRRPPRIPVPRCKVDLVQAPQATYAPAPLGVPFSMKPALLLSVLLLLCACATPSPRPATPPSEAAPTPAPRERRELTADEEKKVLGTLDLSRQEVDQLWLEACAFAPGNSGLLRASATTWDEGGLSWDVELYAPQLDGGVLATFQDRRRRNPLRSEEAPPWEVRCRAGGLDLGYPDALVALRLDEDGLGFDARWGRELPARLGRASDAMLVHLDTGLVAVREGLGIETEADAAAEALLHILLTRAERSLQAKKSADAGAVLERAREMLSGASGEDAPWTSLRARAHAAEVALVHLRLAEAERALAAENDLLAGALLEAIHATRASAPLEEPWASLGERAAVLSRRMADMRSRAPLRVEARHQVGRLPSLPSLPPEDPPDGPDLFWRRGELCVRQTEQPERMRCLDAATRRWKQREPYVSPLSPDWQLTVEEPASKQWRILLRSPEEGTQQTNWLDWPGSLRVIARGKENSYVIAAERPAADTREYEGPPRFQGLESYDVASGPGSFLAGGDLYFAAPDQLRSTRVVGRSWPFAPGVPDAPKGCVLEPLVSPDGRWAACIVERQEEDSGDGHLLWLLELVRG
jgi:hypothetical protein